MENKDAKFLDPGTKTGVFLREVASRLNYGLRDIIKSEQRINHILKNQIFGIGITELPTLMSKRSSIVQSKLMVINQLQISLIIIMEIFIIQTQSIYGMIKKAIANIVVLVMIFMRSLQLSKIMLMNLFTTHQSIKFFKRYEI